MGVPIPKYEDEPLHRRKGFFVYRPTNALVGERPSDVFPTQPQCHASFYPLLLFPGSIVCKTWCDVTLHFIYGALNSSSAFFKVSPSREVVYLGSTEHGLLPTPDSSLPLPTGIIPIPPENSQTPITPGFIEFHELTEGESQGDDNDDDDFREVPAVFLGDEPTTEMALARTFPPCLCCQRKMQYVGQADTDAFSDDIDSSVVVLLYCERCEVQCCCLKQDFFDG